MKGKKLGLYIPLMLVLAAFAVNFPELRRYLRVRRM